MIDGAASRPGNARIPLAATVTPSRQRATRAVLNTRNGLRRSAGTGKRGAVEVKFVPLNAISKTATSR